MRKNLKSRLKKLFDDDESYEEVLEVNMPDLSHVEVTTEEQFVARHQQLDKVEETANTLQLQAQFYKGRLYRDWTATLIRDDETMEEFWKKRGLVAHTVRRYICLADLIDHMPPLLHARFSFTKLVQYSDKLYELLADSSMDPELNALLKSPGKRVVIKAYVESPAVEADPTEFVKEGKPFNWHPGWSTQDALEAFSLELAQDPELADEPDMTDQQFLDAANEDDDMVAILCKAASVS